MKVTGVSGTTFTVSTAQEGTSNVNHSSGVAVTLVGTADAVSRLFAPMPFTPGGRLSMTSGVPVDNANIALTSATVLYYVSYVHSFVPVFDGIGWTKQTITSDNMSFTLDGFGAGHTGWHVANSLFDVFMHIQAGAPELVTGPAWTDLATRSAALTQINGIWVNNASMTAKYDTTSGTRTVAANQGTYLGTIWVDPDTRSGAGGGAMELLFAGTTFGGQISYWNAYNRVPVKARASYQSNWTYATNTWRQMAGQARSKIRFVDGLGQTSIGGGVANTVGTAVAGDKAQFGVNLNSTSATPDFYQTIASATGTLADNYTSGFAPGIFKPVMGANYVAAMENSPNAVTVTSNPDSVNNCQWYEGDF